MSKISKEEVEKIGKLARIDLKDNEKEKFRKELSSVLEFVSQLQELDTKKVEPISQVTGLDNILEDDEIKESFNREDLLKNVPERERSFIKVKKVFENGDSV